MSNVPGRLADVVRGTRWGRWMGLHATEAASQDAAEREQMRWRVQYHLGRGRRAREAGRFDSGVYEARRALAANPREPWALALMGQCLMRKPSPDVGGARQALERARAIEPHNGYFVRLLLDVLDAQGDRNARARLLDEAWWTGAPVDRWLPDGPSRPWADRPAASARREAARGRPGLAGAGAGRQPVPA
jgi:hypothetical protein